MWYENLTEARFEKIFWRGTKITVSYRKVYVNKKGDVWMSLKGNCVQFDINRVEPFIELPLPRPSNPRGHYYVALKKLEPYESFSSYLLARLDEGSPPTE